VNIDGICETLDEIEIDLKYSVSFNESLKLEARRDQLLAELYQLTRNPEEVPNS